MVVRFGNEMSNQIYFWYKLNNTQLILAQLNYLFGTSMCFVKQVIISALYAKAKQFIQN